MLHLLHQKRCGVTAVVYQSNGDQFICHSHVLTLACVCSHVYSSSAVSKISVIISADKLVVNTTTYTAFPCFAG